MVKKIIRARVSFTSSKNLNVCGSKIGVDVSVVKKIIEMKGSGLESCANKESIVFSCNSWGGVWLFVFLCLTPVCPSIVRGLPLQITGEFCVVPPDNETA